MFFVNWFKSLTCREQKKEVLLEPETYTIPKVEYETLLQRLRNLEAMINALPIKPTVPLSPPASINMNFGVEKHHLNPFQIELEKKLNRIRQKMGESHGWGKVDDMNDLEKMEQSVMTQSIRLGLPKITNASEEMCESNHSI